MPPIAVLPSRPACAPAFAVAPSELLAVNSFEQPVYVSRRTPAGLWQEYRIYSDRLELQSWILLHTIVIPAREILEIEVCPSVFSGRKGFTWGIKLDNSDLCRYVRVRRKTGFWKCIAFTPDNPDEFVRVCQSII
jgi:hypothetical protein